MSSATPDYRFYALEAGWFIWPRFYKVFVTPSAICGAYLAGQVYDELSGNRQLAMLGHELGLAFTPLITWLIERRQEREQRYEGVNLSGPEFLKQDRKNFRLTAEEIQQVVLSAQRVTSWTPSSTGIMTMHSWNASRRRLLLVGEANLESVRTAVSRFVPVTGLLPDAGQAHGHE
ncbi:hypothetical protein AYO44_01285 [Planctomycetaceae bacterium SCGC AG-212-F19]|nr:hypothetical protein AYO44_01285 [Planctomycetaceae bacterium SCGC AG-212-F19]